MTIKLITKEQHAELMEIQEKYSVLTYQNKGYEGIQSKLSPEERKAHQRASKIIGDHVVGFSEFNHFTLRKNGDVCIRLQYNWGAEDNTMSFTGVGYLLVDELLNGFKQ